MLELFKRSGTAANFTASVGETCKGYIMYL